MTNMSSANESETGSPSKLLTLSEGPRATFELCAFMAALPLLGMLPRGDGHPVLVLPGFLASDSSSGLMRQLLNQLGYAAYGWGLGRNVRVDNRRLEEMERVLSEIHDANGRKVSIIGWSLGGLFARELAKHQPEAVRQVITLGSPISGDRTSSASSKLFELINGKEPEPIRSGRFASPAEAPPVPTTSILSRSDGVVSWRDSFQGKTQSNDKTENIEVYSSHVGLGFNPSVLIAIADRLERPEGEWSPFKPRVEHKWMFPQGPLNNSSDSAQRMAV